MKHTTKLGKIQQGTARAQAKGAKRKPVVVKGLGIAIVHAMDAVHTTVREAILKVATHNIETVAQSILEVETERDVRLDACSGERKKQKQASIRVMFTRITVILRAFHKGFNVDKIRKAESFAEMYAYASKKARKQDGRHAKPFTEEQATDWSAKVTRIVGEQPGAKATDAERGKFDKQLARLEQHLVDCLGALSKFAHASRIPVRDMLGLVAKRGQQVKLVQKQRKAA